MSKWKKHQITLEVEIREPQDLDSNFYITIHKMDIDEWRGARRGKIIRNPNNHDDMWFLPDHYVKESKEIDDNMYAILTGKEIA